MKLRKKSCSLLTLLSITALYSMSSTAAQQDQSTAILSGQCINPTVRLNVEESRLSARLPQNDDPSQLQSTAFAQEMIDGGGFQDFGPQFLDQLCSAYDVDRARTNIVKMGKKLWQMAVDRVQHKTSIQGDLPSSDDRPLYWTRLQAEAALRQWIPSFYLPPARRKALITSFDKASRGMLSIDFPAGAQVKRLIMSGFDPYTLDGGDNGTADGAAGNNIRHGNPSGVLALAMDGTTYKSSNGQPVYIEAYALPVDYPQFRKGYLEDTVGPFMKPGPRQVDASITVSQAGPYQFNLEQWNGRYHGTYQGNGNYEPCPSINGELELAVDNPKCDILVVPQWGGPPIKGHEFSLRNPPQWTTTSLPIASMIKANTGRNVPRPPGDGWPDQSVAFGVIWHTNYTEFPNCQSTERVTRNTPVPTQYPPPTQPVAPDPQSCAYSGGGGNYLSNESAYRNTLLRDRLGVNIPAGHIHTPNMQHFADGDLYKPSDSTFDAWRLAILKQSENLVHVVAYTAGTQAQNQ